MRHQSMVLAGVAAMSAAEFASASALERKSVRNGHPKDKEKTDRQIRPSESPTFAPSTWFPTFFPTISPVTAEQLLARTPPPTSRPTPRPTRRPTKRKQPTPNP